MRQLFLLLVIVGFVFSFISCGRAKSETKPQAKSEIQLATVEEEEMAEKPAQRYVEGEILVKFKPEVDVDEIARIIKEEYQCEVLDVIKGLDVYRLKVPRGKKVPEMVELLNKDARVKYAEPNMIYRLQQ